ncbi:MAG: CRISPR-associated helicase Cas3', partial [Chloroflexia bacterium]
MPIGCSVDEAYKVLAEFTPNSMQKAVWEKLVNEDDGGLLLLAPTGSGKTEAVTVPGLALGRRIFVILPARSLVDDQIGRFKKMLERASSADCTRPYALIVDTGAQSTRWVWYKGKSVGQSQHRHLYQGDIIVTTLDKFLYRFFGFGEQGKSYTYPLHIRYGLRPPLFCFDEAHSYDTVAWTNFCLLLRTLYEKALDVVAMTATMPSAFAKELDFLTTLDFIYSHNQAKDAGNGREQPSHQLTYFPVPLSDVAGKLIELGKQLRSPQKRVIISVETVRDAVKVFKALRQGNNDVLLYHGRLTADRRQEVYAELKRREAKGKGYLLVTTSAIEVGCDLDAHILITQLCNPEQLLQRVGRCNRRGKIKNAQVIVVGKEIPPYLTTLTSEQQAA